MTWHHIVPFSHKSQLSMTTPPPRTSIMRDKGQLPMAKSAIAPIAVANTMYKILSLQAHPGLTQVPKNVLKK